MVSLTWYWSISSSVLCEEAEKLGLLAEIICAEKNLFYLHGHGKSILFKSTDFGENSSLGYKLADDKELAYTLLERHNFPTAKSVYFKRGELENLSSQQIGRSLSFPVIIKPVSEWHGNGVMMNIFSYDELKEKLVFSFQTYDTLIVQEQISGDEVRVLVVKWEVILALNRVPAHIVGNGYDSIKDLVERENKNNPLRWVWYEAPLSYIKMDHETFSFMEKQWVSEHTIPDKGQVIQLRGNSNIWTWWTIKEVTNELCDTTKDMCIQISKIFGLEIAWIDILTTDVTVPLEQMWWVVLEVNATPGIGWYRELTSVNPWRELLKKIFF